MKGKHGFALILTLAVMIPRLLWFVWLDGELPEPSRDQPIYLRMAASLIEGNGLSFDSSLALLKSSRPDPGETDALAGAWRGSADYVFGLVPVETPTATIEPGYPLLLAAVFLIMGPVTGALFFINCAAFLLGAWAVWKMVSGKWGEAEGRTAALIWALYPWYVYYSAYALTESLHIALIPVILFCLFRTQEGRGSGFLPGFATGILFLIRSTALFLIPLEAVYLFLTGRKRSLLPLIAGFALCMVPWMVRNQIELGSPVLLPTKGALNLWMRNHPGVLELEGIDIPDWIKTSRDDLLEYPDFYDSQGEIERSILLGRRAFAWIVSNPLLFLWLSGDRFLRFLLPISSGLATGPLVLLGALAGYALFIPMLILTFIEFRHRRREAPVRFIAGLFVLYLTLHTFAHGGVRYRLPVDIVPIIGASLFMLRKLRCRKKNTGTGGSPEGDREGSRGIMLQ